MLVLPLAYLQLYTQTSIIFPSTTVLHPASFTIIASHSLGFLAFLLHDSSWPSYLLCPSLISLTLSLPASIHSSRRPLHLLPPSLRALIPPLPLFSFFSSCPSLTLSSPLVSNSSSLCCLLHSATINFTQTHCTSLCSPHQIIQFIGARLCILNDECIGDTIKQGIALNVSQQTPLHALHATAYSL